MTRGSGLLVGAAIFLSSMAFVVTTIAGGSPLALLSLQSAPRDADCAMSACDPPAAGPRGSAGAIGQAQAAPDRPRPTLRDDRRLPTLPPQPEQKTDGSPAGPEVVETLRARPPAPPASTREPAGAGEIDAEQAKELARRLARDLARTQ